jgi:hypothetical protein
MNSKIIVNQQQFNTSCKGLPMVTGGHGSVINIELNFTDYPHSVIEIDFYLFIFDLWRGESLEITFDKCSHLLMDEIYESNNYPRSNICGSIGELYDRVIRVSTRLKSLEKLSNLSLQDFPIITDEFSSSRNWGIFGLNIKVGLKCQENAVKVRDKFCQCVNGFFQRKIDGCVKKGFNESFCYECVPCPQFCDSCLDSLTCIKCQAKFMLVPEGEKAYCEAPEGF